MNHLNALPGFADWQWNLIHKLQSTLRSMFAEGEVEALKKLTSEEIKDFSGSSQNVNYNVSTAINFIHNKKVISVDNHLERELGDILALGVYRENGALRWNRICLIQTKMNKGGAIAIEPGQLSLLSMFPKFKFKGKNNIEHLLRNRSGMLGAYGFFSSDGEMPLISARVLKQMLGDNKSIKFSDLVHIFVSERAARSQHTSVLGSQYHGPFYPFTTIDPTHCPDCNEFYHEYFPRFFPPSVIRHWARRHLHQHHDFNVTPDESVLSCIGMNEFVRSWTELRLGELVHGDDDSESAQALRDLMANPTLLSEDKNMLIIKTTVSASRHEDERNFG
ncbi:MAG: hypothetical protein HQL96_03790 [Magnetococcales bacterium]|nr:hypothetical protein [Magnetococcales bacterium]